LRNRCLGGVLAPDDAAVLGGVLAPSGVLTPAALRAGPRTRAFPGARA
jgi:hypothetical protein